MVGKELIGQWLQLSRTAGAARACSQGAAAEVGIREFPPCTVSELHTSRAHDDIIVFEKTMMSSCTLAYMYRPVYTLYSFPDPNNPTETI